MWNWYANMGFLCDCKIFAKHHLKLYSRPPSGSGPLHGLASVSVKLWPAGPGLPAACSAALAWPGLSRPCCHPLISLSTNSEPRHFVTGLKHQLIFQTQNVQVFVQKENWRVQCHKCYQLQRLNIKWKRKGIHWLYNLACITAASQLVLIHEQQSFK